MGQESRGRRSFGYRSFITCEDPRGVVESSTIIKPKHGKKPVESDRSKPGEEAQNPASFRLLEVSRSAQKLNNVITSWSNGHSRNNTTEMAQDLLKGAIDLGESLSRLSSLQQSSKKKKKMKRSNLIAKLMGLEEAPVRTTFDHDPEESSSWKRRPTLDQMIEAVKSKGVSRRWSDVVIDDRPPIVLLRPLAYSCLDLEPPVVPKSRAEVFEEMFLGMRTRTNPLAQADDYEPLKTEVKEAKPKYGRRREKISGKSEKSWPENIPKTANKNGNQRYNDEHGNLARITEDASQIEITVADYDDYDQSSASETPQLFSNQTNKESSALTVMNKCGGIDEDEVNVCCKDDHSPSSRATASLSSPCIDRLKDLLLSSQQFIKRVEALFDSKANQDTCFPQQAENNVDHSDVSVRELVDAANELVELHGFRCSRAILPLPWTAQKTSSIAHYHYSSLEQVLDQVCGEIEALRWKKKDEGEDDSTDSLQLLVKGDLRSTGMVGGVWDMGWMTTGSADLLEELTRGVDELVLDGLIDEILLILVSS